MSDNLQGNPQGILCDMCLEDRKPARKTCMKCEISMCVQHLQAHLTTPVLLQTHPLTEPTALCGTKCPQHGKLLEYYCLDDMTCVCVSCAIEDQHRLHNMKTFSTAHKELTEQLNNEQQAADESLEKWEKSERETLGRSSVRLIQAVTSLRDIALTSVQSSVSARMAPIRTAKSSMQAAQGEKDAFRFLQMYSQVHRDVEKAKAVDLRKGMEPSADRDKLLQEMRQNGEEMVKQAGRFWGSLLSLVDPENHQELNASSSNVTFDPQKLDPGMSLSKDKRKVFYSSSSGENRHCFSATLPIRQIKTALGLQTAALNLKRWVVSFSQDCDWTLGLCDQQFLRGVKGSNIGLFGHQPTRDVNVGRVYGLRCEGNRLSSHTTECCQAAPVSLVPPITASNPWGNLLNITPPPGNLVTSAPITHQSRNGPRPKVVEMLWNSKSSSLAFFSRTGQHQREEIITLQVSLSTLEPVVQLSKKNDQRIHQQNGPQLQMYQSNDYHGYNHPSGTSGVICTTEVVCELQ
ncbi:Tripartite motif-containing protein 29 [Liparis tanakae]|uniref:Tripartite motif-containing protein 29 n=1 Tax=Liparis tanakae TaxID=230148 RepID=A0A4Z2I1W2_9TELE|nr:Tripartite motif-containing protein 29 [Liparis tanakae]